MLLCDFERAWQETDSIESRRRRDLRVEGGLVSDRRDFSNRIVLLRNNLGLGDSIQFSRYLPLIKQKCHRLIAKARPILVRLLKTFNCIDAILKTAEGSCCFSDRTGLNKSPNSSTRANVASNTNVEIRSVPFRDSILQLFPRHRNRDEGLRWGSRCAEIRK